MVCSRADPGALVDLSRFPIPCKTLNHPNLGSAEAFCALDLNSPAGFREAK